MFGENDEVVQAGFGQNDEVIDTITTPQNPNIELGKVLQTMGLAGGIVGGLKGLEKIGGGIGKYFYQPEVRQQRSALQKELGGIQKELNITGTEPSFIPTKISRDIQEINQQKNIDIGHLERATKQTSQNFKNQLNILDDTLISLNAEDLAKTIKSGYPEFLKSASDAYGAGLDATDVYFSKYGKQFDNQSFSLDVLDKTINKARSSGVLDDQMSSLMKLRESLSPTQGSEKVFVSRPMSFSEAKGYVSNLINENPYGATAGMLRENWGDFLEQNAPSEVRGMINKLNSDFKPFAEARTMMSKLINTRTGEFDQKGLIKYLIEHTKRRYDEGVVNLMKYLGEGSDLVSPIGGVKEKFGALSQLREKRATIKSNIGQIPIVGRDKIDFIKNQVEEEVSKMQSLKTKAQELLSKSAVVEEKLASRNPAKAIAKVFGRKFVPFLGVAPMFLDAINYAKDPSLYKAVQETGIGEEQLKNIRDAYNRMKLGNQSKEDENLLVGAGLIS